MLMENQKYLRGEPVFETPVLAAVDPEWCRGVLPADTELWPYPMVDLHALREVFDRAERACLVRIYVPEPVAWMTSRIAAGMAPISAESNWSQMAEMALGLSVDPRVELEVLTSAPARQIGPTAWVDLVVHMICRGATVGRLLERIALVSDAAPPACPEDRLDHLWSELTSTNPFQSVPQIDLQSYQLEVDRREQSGRPASQALMQERLIALQQLAEDSHRHALEIQREVDALRASRSWRITAPLRRLADIVRKFRR